MTPSLRLARVLCLAASLALPLSFASAADPAPGSAPGQAPDAGAPTILRIDVLMIAMPQDKFIALLPDLTNPDKIEKVIPELLEAVKKKEMILEGFPIITTKSGQRAVAETVKEVRYHVDPTPTPAPQPGTSTPAAQPAASGTQPAASGTDAAASGTAPAAPAAQASAPAQPGAPSYVPVDPEAEPPSEFETRNVGVTLEVEPILLADGKTIDLNIAPQHIQLLGFQKPPKPGEKQGPLEKEDAKPITGQPIFYDMKDSTSVTLHDGQHMLLGIHKSAQPEGYVEIFIVHAETITIDK